MELLAAQARGGAVVIVILHDLTMAARYCDRVLLLDRGRIAADGPPRAVLNAELLAAVYGIRAAIDLSEERPLIIPLERISRDVDPVQDGPAVVACISAASRRIGARMTRAWGGAARRGVARGRAGDAR